ncbi:hypothetical protein R3J22_08200 [Trueperella bernardiae]|nr:hypothetical protein [Trueperella bernardiae]
MAKSMRLGRAGIAIVVGTALALLASILLPLLRPDPEPMPRGNKVVFVGMTGLPWEAVGPRTPTLLALAENSAIANVSVRTFDLTTCSLAGWATLNTGVRMRGLADSQQPCQEYGGTFVGRSLSQDGRLGVWDTLLEHNESNPLRPAFGALATTVTDAGLSVASIGGGGAVAIADDDGRPLGPALAVSSYGTVNQVVEAYELVSDADLVVIDLGSAHRDTTPSSHLEAALVPPGQVSAHTRAVAETIDSQLGELIATLEPGTTLIVSSIGDSDRRAARLQIFLETVIGESHHGLATSASTRKGGLIQNVDVHAAILDALGLTAPATSAGAAVTFLASDAGPATLVDANDRAIMTRAVVVLFYLLFVFGAALIFAAMIITIRGGRFGLHHVFALGVVAAMPVASFLINLLPWWRAGRFSTISFTVGVILIALAIAELAMLVVRRATRRRLAEEQAETGQTSDVLTAPDAGGLPAIALGPVLIACLTAVVIGVDAMLGSHLHASSVLGDQPQSGGRFYGISNAPFAIWAVSMIFLAVVAARVLAGRWIAVGVVSLLGSVAIFINGAPHIGADFGGPPPLLIGFLLLILMMRGVRITPLRVIVVGVAAAALAVGISWLDWLRPDPTHLGHFFQSLLDGQALDVVARKAHQLFTQVPWPSWIVAAVVLTGVVVAVRRAGLDPLRDRTDFPELRAGAIAAITTLLIAMLINDSGLVIPLIGGIYMGGLWVIAGLDGTENERYGRNVFETPLSKEHARG